MLVQLIMTFCITNTQTCQDRIIPNLDEYECMAKGDTYAERELLGQIDARYVLAGWRCVAGKMEEGA